MAVYTTQQVFPARSVGGKGRVLVVDANGGSVTVEYRIGENWIVEDVITTDGAFEFENNRSDVRITPAGGAEYAVN